MNKKFFLAVATLTGTMIGVGIFGLPFAFAKAGFWIGLISLLTTGILTLLVNHMYGEVVLRTHDKHQLVGYTRKYLNIYFQRIIFFTAVLTGYAALLAYIIISGDFLNILFSNVFYLPLSTYGIIFFCVMALLTWRGLKTISKAEFVIAGLLVAVIVAMIVTGTPKVNLENFRWQITEYWFLPYGVLMFAFAGMLAVPIQREILAGREYLLRKAITFGVLFVAVFYVLFAALVVGISGDVTSPDAISGLFEFLGPRITFIGALFGLLAVSMAFLMHSAGMIAVFNYDFNIPRRRSWALATLVPLLLYIGGIRTFVNVIGLAGAVALGLEYVVIVLLYMRVKRSGDRVPEYSLSLPGPLLWVLITIFIAGMGYALVK